MTLLKDKTFEGYTRGEDRNGFACPYFTFDQAQRLVEVWKETGSDASDDNSKDEFTFQMSYGEQDSFGPVARRLCTALGVRPGRLFEYVPEPDKLPGPEQGGATKARRSSSASGKGRREAKAQAAATIG